MRLIGGTTAAPPTVECVGAAGAAAEQYRCRLLAETWASSKPGVRVGGINGKLGREVQLNILLSAVFLYCYVLE